MPPSSAAYNAGLLALQQQQRASLTALIEQVDGSLAANWQQGVASAAGIYGPLLDRYAKDLNALRIANDDPAAALSLSWLTSQNTTLASIEQSVAASLNGFGQSATNTITSAQAAVSQVGASDAAALTQRSLWPAVEGAGVPPAMLFNRPNPDAIAQWVGRAGNGHPLGDLFSNFGSEATTEARKAMMLGLLTGANPTAMASGISQAMGISRSRATIIARTEVLGSYRSAAHETYRANSDVLNGWLWSAGGSSPCACCMGMDGLQFSLEEELIDHVCGKCAPLPITKPWDDILGPLGIDSSDMAETSIGAPGAYETGPEKFARMTPEQQQRIIGTKTGYEAYQRGEVSLKDFIGKRPAQDGWPAQYYQKSLREMQIPTRQASRLVEQSPEIREKLAAGNLRASDLGKRTPEDKMPAWAKQSDASRIVYQIMRDGLPYDMASHEYPLLVTNLEKMLTEDLPVNVRAAAERQLQMLGQTVERQTLGAAARDIAAQATRDATTSAEAEAAQVAAISPDMGTAAEMRAEFAQHLFGNGGTAYYDWEPIEQTLGAQLADNPDVLALAQKVEIYDAQADEIRTAQNAQEAIHSILSEYHGGYANNATPLMVAIQNAAEQEFGLSARAYVRDADLLARAEAEFGDVLPGIRAIERQMYDNTQAWFKEQGITEVRLYRGLKFKAGTEPEGVLWDAGAQQARIQTQAATSFSADPMAAIRFSEGRGHSMIAGAEISIERILSIPQTGFGAFNDEEALVLGGDDLYIVLPKAASQGALGGDYPYTLDEVYEALSQELQTGAR